MEHFFKVWLSWLIRVQVHWQQSVDVKVFYSSDHRTEWRCRFYTTLRQACYLDIQKAQFVFKDLMIHWILKFTLLIGTGYVLHRWTSQEIHHQKLYSVYFHFLYRLFLKETDKWENQWYYWETVKGMLNELRWLRTWANYKKNTPQNHLKREVYPMSFILSTVGFCHVGKR